MRRLPLCILFLLVWLAPARAQTAEEKRATVAYLQKLQAGDGGFLAAAPHPTAGRREVSSLRATTSALRALKYFGGEPRDRDACVKYVQNAFDAQAGGFFDVQPSVKPDVFATAAGLMAVVELKLPAEKYVDPGVKFLGENADSFEEIRLAAAALEVVGKRPPQADAWLEQITKVRNPDGTYGKGNGAARDTGGAVVAVLRLGGKVEGEEKGAALHLLQAGQREDGGFGKADAKGSDLESSYRVMRAFHMLGAKPDVNKLRDFVTKCRTEDGGYGVAPGQPSTVSGTYYAASIRHWLNK